MNPKTPKIKTGELVFTTIILLVVSILFFILYATKKPIDEKSKKEKQSYLMTAIICLVIGIFAGIVLAILNGILDKSG